MRACRRLVRALLGRRLGCAERDQRERNTQDYKLGNSQTLNLNPLPDAWGSLRRIRHSKRLNHAEVKQCPFDCDFRPKKEAAPEDHGKVRCPMTSEKLAARHYRRSGPTFRVPALIFLEIRRNTEIAKDLRFAISAPQRFVDDYGNVPAMKIVPLSRPLGRTRNTTS